MICGLDQETLCVVMNLDGCISLIGVVTPTGMNILILSNILRGKFTHPDSNPDLYQKLYLICFIRWRGENVSTIEVESVISNVLKQQDTIVYGVQVPGVEGRAGMAAIVQPEGGIDLNWFLSAIKNQLPSYAMPIFLRMVKELDITGM